jgi:AbiTii
MLKSQIIWIIRNLGHLGDFLGINGAVMRNFPLEISRLPKELQKTFSIREFRHGVQALKGLVTTHHDGFMTLGWRPEIHKLFDHSGFGLGMRLTSAWTVLPTAVIEGILDAIRNNVLTFTMQLEAVGINPGQDEEIRAVDENTSGKITQIFNQTIYGSVSNIGRADSVSTSSHVVLRNLQSLNAALQEAGVEEGDIKGLNTALARDEKEGKPADAKFGRNVSKWLGDMFSKSAAGAIKIGTDIVSDVITKQIDKYTGPS